MTVAQTERESVCRRTVCVYLDREYFFLLRRETNDVVGIFTNKVSDKCARSALSCQCHMYFVDNVGRYVGEAARSAARQRILVKSHRLCAHFPIILRLAMLSIISYQVVDSTIIIAVIIYDSKNLDRSLNGDKQACRRHDCSECLHHVKRQMTRNLSRSSNATRLFIASQFDNVNYPSLLGLFEIRGKYYRS